MKDNSIAALHARIQNCQRILIFTEVLNASLRREFSARHDQWTRKNPALGHDLSAALLGQHTFGGEILQAALSQHIVYHWNLIEGREVHFTRFVLDGDVGTLKGTPMDRETLLASDEGLTAVRYQMLCDSFERVERALKAHEERLAAQTK